MSRPLRRWQHKGIIDLAYAASEGLKRTLVYACPASGKTYFGLLAAVELRDRVKLSDKVLVLTPSLNVKNQWIRWAEEVGLNLIAVDDRARLRGRVDDMFSAGFIMTYQSAISRQKELKEFCDRYKPVAILDEIHHTPSQTGNRKGNVWGRAVEIALENCGFILAMTGTPFRQARDPIAFVKYNEEGIAISPIQYNYRSAIQDGVCRPVYFETYGGPERKMEWTDYRGVSLTASFDDELSKKRSRERLAAAVSLNGKLAPKMLAAANQRLNEVRFEQGSEKAGGFVVAVDHNHADEIGDLLTKISGRTTIVVHSGIDESQEKIDAFRDSDAPWIVGVQMLSEGLDIPRLRVGVYCTTIKAPLYFHQFCGRVMRIESSHTERGWVFLPEDPDLKEIASQIQEDVAYAIGDDIPKREIAGRPGVTRSRGMRVHDSDGEHHYTIYANHIIPDDFMKRHETTLLKAMQDLPGKANIYDIAISLVNVGVLPPFNEESGGNLNAATS